MISDKHWLSLADLLKGLHFSECPRSGCLDAGTPKRGLKQQSPAIDDRFVHIVRHKSGKTDNGTTTKNRYQLDEVVVIETSFVWGVLQK